MSKNLVIQFSKWPSPGKVKTRLAAVIGTEAAYAAHLDLFQFTLRQLLQDSTSKVKDWDVAIWWNRLESAKLTNLALDPELKSQMMGLRHEQQTIGDLGVKMRDALTKGLNGYERVVIVGSDCPSVDGRYLNQAFHQLQQHDVVIGPAEDGGYVLIGARSIEPAMFQNIEWGSDQVLTQTLTNLDSVGLSYGCLEQRWDVDELEDWRRFCREYASSD